jgi:ABC-type glycerol-3-phosphate transport system permease component
VNELVGKDSKKGKLQRLKGIIKKFTNFFGRRHIWSGLLAGFLWAFSAPFLLTAFLSSFQILPEEAKWIFFLPLKSSLELTYRVVDLEHAGSGVWILVWIMSVFVGMLLGVVFTYSIHRIRVWRRTRNISRTVPSE